MAHGGGSEPAPEDVTTFRDIRGSWAWRLVEDHFTRSYGPALDRVGTASDVRAAPDGRRAAFVGEVRHAWQDRPSGRTCLVDLTGPTAGTLTELSHPTGTDRTPRWSPDGHRLAFLSDQGTPGRHRPWLTDPDTGTTTAGPTLPGTAEYLAWSPDSRRILVGVVGDPAGRDHGVDHGSDHGSGNGLDHPSWLPTVSSDTDACPTRTVWVFDLDGGPARPMSLAGLAVWEADWSGPDRIAAIVSDGGSENDWYGTRLVLIDAATGMVSTLYPHPGRQLAQPCGSPDGRWVAVLESWCSDRGVMAGAVVAIETAGGTASTVDTRGVDVTDLEWSAGDVGSEPGSWLLYSGIREPETVVGSWIPGTGSVTEEWVSTETVGGFYPEASPLPGGGFVGVVNSYRRYPDLSVVRDGRAESVLDFRHGGADWLVERAGEVTAVRWEAEDGWEIGGLLCAPDGPGPRPLVLHVHGGPVLAFRNRWQLGYPLVPLLVSRGYAVLSANPRGSTGRGRAFVDAVAGDMGGKDAGDLLAGVDAMVAAGVADPQRLGVTGHSYGGYMSCLLVGLTERFRAAVAQASVTDWYTQHHASDLGVFDNLFLGGTPYQVGGPHFTRSPVARADRVRTPVLLTAGTEDRGVPPVQSLEFHRALREQGVPTALAVYPGEGHVPRGQRALLDLHARLVAWFGRYLG
jgi:dipeptidyl aminopeptidase/acylaminoacyl peptidase